MYFSFIWIYWYFAGTWFKNHSPRKIWRQLIYSGTVGITNIENLVEWNDLIFNSPHTHTQTHTHTYTHTSNVSQPICWNKTQLIKAHDNLIQNPKYVSSSDIGLVLAHLTVDIPIRPTPHRRQIASVPTVGRVLDNQQPVTECSCPAQMRATDK
jgi:TPP-dependent 2-oxoacid decarboxylase